MRNPGRVIVTDAQADKYEKARADYDKQRAVMTKLAKRLRTAEGPIRLRMGEAGTTAVRESGKLVCVRERSVTEHGPRDDLRAVPASFTPEHAAKDATVILLRSKVGGKR